METINISKQPDGTYKVYFHNRASIGEFIVGDDGYFGYWPDLDRHGYWEASVLRAIAYKLDELNADWHKQIQQLET